MIGCCAFHPFFTQTTDEQAESYRKEIRRLASLILRRPDDARAIIDASTAPSTPRKVDKNGKQLPRTSSSGDLVKPDGRFSDVPRRRSSLPPSRSIFQSRQKERRTVLWEIPLLSPRGITATDAYEVASSEASLSPRHSPRLGRGRRPPGLQNDRNFAHVDENKLCGQDAGVRTMGEHEKTGSPASIVSTQGVYMFHDSNRLCATTE